MDLAPQDAVMLVDHIQAVALREPAAERVVGARNAAGGPERSTRSLA
jgi:hypothetical protein